jgi:predicted PurR-regulated permease PerM
MRRYFRGQFIVALCVGILFSIGFSLIGLPMAVPFGLFIGALNMVPYLQIVGLVPAALLALVRSIDTGGSVMFSIVLVLLVFGVVQLLQDAVIVPRVMGKATGLRPVSILLGVFIWGKLLGFIGLILAIPLTCLGIAYYRRHVLAAAGDGPAGEG